MTTFSFRKGCHFCDYRPGLLNEQSRFKCGNSDLIPFATARPKRKCTVKACKNTFLPFTITPNFQSPNGECSEK